MLRFVVLLIACFFAKQCRADVDCSEKPEMKLFRTCCPIPLKLAQIAQKCEKEFPEEKGSQNFCFHKCIFDAAGLITNDVIQVAKADSILSRLYRYLPHVSVVKTVFQKCANKNLENQQHMLEKLEEHHISDDCSPVSLFMASCLFPEILKNCPAEKLQTSIICKRTKDYLSFCMQD